MKRYLILGVLLLIIASAGCTGETTFTPATTAAAPTTTIPKTTVAPETTTLSQLCEKSIFPQTCLALVNENPDLCENEENVDTCYSDLAIITKNPDLCEKYYEGISLTHCYRELAIATKNSSLCEKVDNPGACYSTRLAVSTEDSSLCARTYDSNSCYREVASELNDPSICEKVTFLKQRCLAVVNENPELCSNADRPEGCLNEVYKRLSITKKDISYCDKLKTEPREESWDCYWDVAVAAKDPAICETDEYLTSSVMSESLLEDLCYGHVAKKLKNPALCDKISGRCYYDVVVAMKKS